MTFLPAPSRGAVVPFSRWLFAALGIVALLLSLIAAWVLTAGPDDETAHAAAFLAHLFSPWMLASYVAAAIFVGGGLLYLQRVPPATPLDDTERVLRQSALRFALVFVCAAASLSGIGWLYLDDTERQTRAEGERALGLAARLNAQTIGRWLLARSVDSERMASALEPLPLERVRTEDYLRRAIDLLFAETLSGTTGAIAITLFDAEGKVLLHAGEGVAPGAAIAAAAPGVAATPLEGRRIVDLHEDGSPMRARLGFLAPVPARGARERAVAVVAITADPYAGLLDRLQTLPEADVPAEIMVVSREGNDVVFVTPPKVSPPVAPNRYRLPLADQASPAVQAVLRGSGIYRGTNRAGTEVVAVARQVSGVPWLVLAQADEAALTAPVDRQQGVMVIVIGASVAFAGLMLTVLARAQLGALRGQAEASAVERRAITRHFDAATQLARDIVMVLDDKGRILTANEAAVRAYGYSEEEFYHLNIRDLRTPEEVGHFERDWRNGGSAGVLIETVHRRRDGTTFPVEISGRDLEIGGLVFRQGIVRDISRRRRLECELRRLSQVRSALQAATSVLLRATDEATLLARLCEVMVKFGAYRGAFVAVPVDDAAHSVRFPAMAGIEESLLAGAAICWDEASPGCGPTGRALATGTIQTDRHAADAARPEMMECNAAACVALPVTADGRVLAALTLLAEQPEAFDAEEVALLAALADDIAFALTRLRTA